MRRAGAVEERLSLEGTKRCARCREEKPRSEFWAHKRAKDGRCSWCRPCMNAYMSSRRVRKRPPKPPDGFKRCSRCREVKPVEEFFRNAARHDGLTSYCKVCFPEHAAYMRSQQSRGFKHNKARYVRGRRRTDPGFRRKDDVRNFTRLAVRLGLITRHSCSACGNPNTEAHHTDYTKPLEVQWLCKEHHKGLGHGGDFATPPVPVPVLAMMA